MMVAPSKVSDLLHKNSEGLSMETIRQAASKIKRMFVEHLADETLAAYYAVTTSHRVYANTRHGVRVEKEKIRIV